MCFKMYILICPASLARLALWGILPRTGVHTLIEIIFRLGAFSIKTNSGQHLTDNLRPLLNLAKPSRRIKNFEVEDKNLYTRVWGKLCYLRSWSLYAAIPKISFVCKNWQVVANHTYVHTNSIFKTTIK